MLRRYFKNKIIYDDNLDNLNKYNLLKVFQEV